MSDLEKQKLRDQMSGMGPEELKIVAECLPSAYMWDELVRRDIEKTRTIEETKKILTDRR